MWKERGTEELENCWVVLSTDLHSDDWCLQMPLWSCYGITCVFKSWGLTEGYFSVSLLCLRLFAYRKGGEEPPDVSVNSYSMSMHVVYLEGCNWIAEHQNNYSWSLQACLKLNIVFIFHSSICAQSKKITLKIRFVEEEIRENTPPTHVHPKDYSLYWPSIIMLQVLRTDLKDFSLESPTFQLCNLPFLSSTLWNLSSLKKQFLWAMCFFFWK